MYPEVCTCVCPFAQTCVPLCSNLCFPWLTRVCAGCQNGWCRHGRPLRRPSPHQLRGNHRHEVDSPHRGLRQDRRPHHHHPRAPPADPFRRQGRLRPPPLPDLHRAVRRVRGQRDPGGDDQVHQPRVHGERGGRDRSGRRRARERRDAERCGDSDAGEARQERITNAPGKEQGW